MIKATEKFSNREWLVEKGFSALAEVSILLDTDENIGRDANGANLRGGIVKFVVRKIQLETYVICEQNKPSNWIL